MRIRVFPYPPQLLPEHITRHAIVTIPVKLYWVTKTLYLNYTDTVRHISIGHYNNVIMSAMASQITKSPTSRLLTKSFIQGADQRKHQSSASLAFVLGIHRWIPRTKASYVEIFPLDGVITCINDDKPSSTWKAYREWSKQQIHPQVFWVWLLVEKGWIFDFERGCEIHCSLTEREYAQAGGCKICPLK